MKMNILVVAEGGLRGDDPVIAEIIEALKLDAPKAMNVALQDAFIYGSADEMTVSVLLCNNLYLKNLATEWRGEACIVNLIADQNSEALKSGNIAISVETAAQQAELRGHSLLDEVRVLLAHGLLQFLYLHGKTVATEVRIKEKQILDTLNCKTGPLDDVHKGATKFKYIFCDMDGTLLDSRSLVTEANAEAIRVASSRGVKTIIATGKTRPAVMKVLNTVNLSGTEGIVSESSPGVFLQGLLVYGEGGEKIYQKNLDVEVTREALLYSVKNRIALVAFSEDDCYTMFEHHLVEFFHTIYHEPKAKIIPSGIDDFLSTIDIQKVVFLEAPEVITSLLRPYWQKEVMGKAQIVQAQSDVLEIVPLGTSKGKGVEILLRSLCASPDQIMAIGDGENDKEMIELAGLGVAMSNGCAVTKSVATVIGASNDEDGVAQAIYKYL